MKLKHWSPVFALILCVAFVAQAAPPEAPKVSTFAPAKDLSAQLNEYVEELEECVESKDEFADSESKIGKSANTVSVIALALGLSDEDNKYKKAAPALIKAAQAVASAKDYDAAKKAVDALRAAMTAEGDASKLSWESKVASMPELMAQVPLVNTKLKRYARGSRMKRKADDLMGYTAVIAAIGQASMANAEDTEKPNEAQKWYAYCAQMRDAAAAVNKAIADGDADAVQDKLAELQQSCDDCHAVFHEEEL
jgi:class 3 adenylate cyclase